MAMSDATPSSAHAFQGGDTARDTGRETGRPGGAIDLAHLRHYTAGDEAVIRDVLQIFRGQAAEWVSTLTPDLADEQWHDLAHSLKGSARGIGAFEIARIAEAAENLGGADNRTARQALLDHLNDELIRVLCDIDRLLR